MTAKITEDTTTQRAGRPARFFAPQGRVFAPQGRFWAFGVYITVNELKAV